MALSIKNARTERLARELAEATGATITAAITAALSESLEKVRPRPDRRAAVLAELERISSDAARRWPPELRTVNHGDLLYDEDGLPR